MDKEEAKNEAILLIEDNDFNEALLYVTGLANGNYED